MNKFTVSHPAQKEFRVIEQHPINLTPIKKALEDAKKKREDVHRKSM